MAVYQSEWLNQINNINSIENNIDYFFTQRKVTEIEEIIDEKTLEIKRGRQVFHPQNQIQNVRGS